MSDVGSNLKSFAIRPSLQVISLLGLVLLPGVILGALTWIYREGQLAGSFVSAVSLGIWLSVATLRVELSEGILSMRRFGFRRWAVDARSAILRDGGGGDGGLLPAILVFERKTKKKIGYILKVQFSARDIAALRVLLAQCTPSSAPSN